MTETESQKRCEYCHNSGCHVPIVSRDIPLAIRCGITPLVNFTAYPGDFEVGADVYVSGDGYILLDTGDENYNDYEHIKFCPMCGRKLGDNDE